MLHKNKHMLVLGAGLQISQQTLEEPNVLINEIRFKSLGFLPGTARQFGEIKPLSGDTFLVSKHVHTP